MKFDHKTNHTFTPDLDFWRSMEDLFDSFPYWEGKNKFHSKDNFIHYYEMNKQESFDGEKNDKDIYGKQITEPYIFMSSQIMPLRVISEKRRGAFPHIMMKTNHTARIIKFLSKNISNQIMYINFSTFWKLHMPFWSK